MLRRRLPLLAIALYVAIQAALLLSVDLPEYDEAIYLNVARNLREHGQLLRGNGSIYADHTPLYQLLLGGLTALLGEQLPLLRLLTAGFGFGALGLAFQIVRREADRTAAGVAMLLIAGSAFFNLYSFFLRPELPMLFFTLLAAERYQRGRAWQAGVALAVALLFKELALIFLPALLLHALLGRRVRDLVALGLPAAVALATWLLFVYIADPARVAQTIDRWQRSIAGPSGGLADSRSATALGSWLQTVGGELLGWGLVLLLLLALMTLLIRRRRLVAAGGLMLLYIVLAVALSTLLTLKEPRHHITLIPAAAIVVACAIDWRGLLDRRPLLTLGALLLVVWNIGPLQLTAEWQNVEAWWQPAFRRRMFEDDRYYGVLRPTGAYLQTIVDEGEMITVAHQGTVLGYYADRPYRFLYTLSLADLLTTLEGTELLVYDSDAFPLLGEDEAQQARDYVEANFELFAEIDDGRRRVAILRRR